MSEPGLTTGSIGIGDLALQGGQVLPQAEIAYATVGTLAPDGGNAVLVTHGFTSSHLFIGRGGPASSEGSWGALVGPGAPIDTDRYFVVSSNMLGSSFGSTAPASVNPLTGRRYGPDFPELSLADIVAGQHRMLQEMGITRLVAVVGPSYGGFQALTWGIEYPDFMRGLSMSVSGLRSPGGSSPEQIRAQLATDPNWNGGHYYDQGGIKPTMAKLREATLRNYGVDVSLQERFPDPAERDREIARQAALWADMFDGNSLIALSAASRKFDARPGLARIKARVQYVLSRTDKLFPPSTAPATMQAFRDAGVQAEYVEIDSEFGHHAAGADAAKWGPALGRFLASL